MFERSLLAGQRILVTGGGTGLGKAIAEGFLAHGADLVICGRRKHVCEEVVRDWLDRFPGRSIACFGVDIRDSDAVEAMMAGIWEGGSLTGLVNNAAGNFVAQTHEISARGFDAIANIVFHGTFYVTNSIGKRWIADAKEGRWTTRQPFRNIISIITTWVDTGSPFVVPSAMSKAGIDVMTKSLAVEWSPYGIRINAVGPGEIPTVGMSKRLNPGERSGAHSVLSARNPMGRVGRLSELQNLANFLMAPGQCDWLSGQSIMMDGANSLATGGTFYDLRSWSDADWKAAKEHIRTQDGSDLKAT